MVVGVEGEEKTRSAAGGRKGKQVEALGEVRRHEIFQEGRHRAE